MSTEIDWEALRLKACEAMHHAYAPYSDFPVGVAGLVDDGRIVSGCNVENASYGIGLCAECGMISQLQVTGGGRLIAVACVDGNGAPLMPCGRCRQLLWEHGGPGCLVDAEGGPQTMAELLPHAFGREDLHRVEPDMHLESAQATVPPAQVPARLAEYTGTGTVFVHPDTNSGHCWTAYWERAAGFGTQPDAEKGTLEEGPLWGEVAEAVAWGHVRSPRVVVIDSSGTPKWAGTGERPEGIAEDWIQH